MMFQKNKKSFLGFLVPVLSGLLLLASSGPLHSSEHHHHSHQQKPKNGIHQLLDIFHNALAGAGHQHHHGSKDFFVALIRPETAKKIVQQFNLKKILLRTVRSYNIQQDKEKLRGHIKNLAFIFPLSHLLEISLSPTFAVLGTMREWPDWLVTSGTSVLSIVVIPGFDPLCLLIFVSYPLPPVYKSINFLRMGVEKSGSWVLRTIPIEKLLDTLYAPKESSLAFLESTPIQGIVFERQDNRIKISLQEVSTKEGIVTLEIADQVGVDGKSRLFTENPPYLEKIVINRAYLDNIPENMVKNIFKKFSKVFPWNPKNAVMEVARSLAEEKWQTLDSEFYIESVDSDAGTIEIHYGARAIPFPYKRISSTKKRKMQKMLMDCQQLLSRF